MSDYAATGREPRGMRGFWQKRVNDLAVIETILRNRHHFFLEIRDGVGLAEKVQAMLVSSFLFLALYGAVLGSTHSLWQTLSSAVKLPLLFLATLIVCSPTLYFFNVLFGSNQSLTQNVALILTAITVTAVLMLSFAPIVVFFLLTTSGYQFLDWLTQIDVRPVLPNARGWTFGGVR
jgi:hypothetical protein